MNASLRAILPFLLAALLTACPEENKPAPAATDSAPRPAPIAVAPPPTTADAGKDGAKRFDPKHVCPTGQTHFYFEGDFCRRRCFSDRDCAKRERCNPIEYPYVVDGGTAGTARFCEGV